LGTVEVGEGCRPAPPSPATSLSSTRVLGKWDRPSRAASSEPNDSALSSAGSSFAPPPFLPRRGAAAASACASARNSRNSTTSLARASDGTTSSSSPARGISRMPLTRTGTAGPASDSCAPSSSSSSRTLPQLWPATTWSPCRRAPRCTSTLRRAQARGRSVSETSRAGGYSQLGSVGWAGVGSVGFTPGAGRGSGGAVHMLPGHSMGSGRIHSSAVSQPVLPEFGELLERAALHAQLHA